MAIEFQCSECGKLLSVPDGSEGKEARCPSCQAIMDIPGVAKAVAVEPVVDPPAAPSGEMNPYAAPAIETPQLENLFVDETDVQRDGPPWERGTVSVTSFFATVKSILLTPNDCFRTMRRRGGIGMPLLFGLVGGLVGAAISHSLTYLLHGSLIPLSLGLGIMTIVTIPVSIALGIFLMAAIVHLLLRLLGGAPYGFETTFRVTAYVSGATNLLSFLGLLPFVGIYLTLLIPAVYTIFGLAQAHQISNSKAATAVLIPVVICGGYYIFYHLVLAPQLL